MMWIIGLLLFLLEFWILKHTTYYAYEYDFSYSRVSKWNKLEEQPITLRIWHIILLIIFNIHFMSLVFLFIFIAFYIFKISEIEDFKYGNTYWRLRVKNNRFFDFLNKKV